MEEELCVHGIGQYSCSYCKNGFKPAVYITAGGMAYHKRPDCPALEQGQRYVVARGGTVAPVETAALGPPRLDDRTMCRTCL